MMNLKKIAVTLALGAAILVGSTGYAFATDVPKDEAGKYSLKDMLTYAIQDEYAAQAEYDKIMKTFGTQKPFSNIIKAEAIHISELQPLLTEYQVAVPENNSAANVVIPGTLDEAYKIAVNAEIKNIAMYKDFLTQDLPTDVRDTFNELMTASVKHQASFQKSLDNAATHVNGFGYGKNQNSNGGTGFGRNQNSNGGSGYGRNQNTNGGSGHGTHK